MQCIIGKNCFENGYQRDLSLIIGLSTFEREYNTVTVTDPSIFDNDVYEDLSKEDRDILLNTFYADLNRTEPYEGETVIIDAHGNSEDRRKIFTPHEAVSYLKQPLVILLENDRYDGRFIRRIISELGNARVKSAIQNNTIKMGNSGGCANTGNTLDEAYRGCSCSSKFLRCFVVWDSDREFPHKIVTKYDMYFPVLKEMNIKYHILDKREMENYLPEEAIKVLALPHFKNWFDAYASLSDVQKDYIDINGGFKKDRTTTYDSSNRHEMTEEIKNLFSDVSNANFEYLKGGLKIGDFKDNFSRAFEISPFANKAALQERTAHQPNPHELQDIVDTINQLL